MRSPLLFCLAPLAVLLGASACTKNASTEKVYTGQRTARDAGAGRDVGPESLFDKPALLGAIAECTVEQLRVFDTRARTLAERTATLRADPAAASARVSAQEAFRAAMATWQELELFRFGPAARTMEPGGRGLRDQIYGWPLVSLCKIDEQLVSEAYASVTFADSLINGRGLAAIEALLFSESAENHCSSFSEINARGTWAALTPEVLAARRAAYAAAAATDVAARSAQLLAAWEAGGFRDALRGAGSGSALFPTDHDGLNAVSDAFFYVDKELKDLKLGRPLGLSDCDAATCPELVESPFARLSRDNVTANLIGFRKLYEGCGEGGAGLGFDDWLRARGAPDLADDIAAVTRTALETNARLAGPLEDALASNMASVQSVYDAVKDLNDFLKADFITVLDLELPMSVEGDND